MKSPARGSDNTKPSATELEVDDAALLTELELDGGLPSRPYLLSFRSFSLSSLPLSFLSFSLSSLPDFRRDLRGVELRGEPAERYICSAFPHICRECQTHTHTQRERERDQGQVAMHYVPRELVIWELEMVVHEEGRQARPLLLETRPVVGSPSSRHMRRINRRNE